MEAATSPINRIGKKLGSWLNAGFAAMARYPCDLDELPWTLGVDDLPDGPSDVATRRPRRSRSAGSRTIKLVPPPASQRYHGEKPRRVPIDVESQDGPNASVNAE